MVDLQILQGDCRERLKELPDGSVHCCVTSPPYFGLRDYQVSDQIGHEMTPEAYVAQLLEVFREVRRVLRDDGTLWLNLGDNYWGSWQNYGGGNRGAGKQRPIIKGSRAQNPVWEGMEGYRPAATQKHPTLKPKDLIGIPWRVAFALQADGWWLRSDIIWSKPNPMTESMQDRCTKAHEYIFLFSKSAQYFYDHEAIKEPAAVGFNGSSFTSDYDKATKPGLGMGERVDDGKRNRRSVWTIPTRRYAGAHFATYPPELIKPCILAGTSASGCCAKCGAPWTRIVEKGLTAHDGKTESAYAKGSTANRLAMLRQAARARGAEYANTTKTIGWQPACKCEGVRDLSPCVVLDPFAGSGTTGKVALELGRSAILIELNTEYIKLIEKRCRVNLPLMFDGLNA